MRVRRFEVLDSGLGGGVWGRGLGVKRFEILNFLVLVLALEGVWGQGLGVGFGGQGVWSSEPPSTGTGTGTGTSTGTGGSSFKRSLKLEPNWNWCQC